MLAQSGVHLFISHRDAACGGLVADQNLFDHVVQRLRTNREGAGERGLQLGDLRLEEALVAELHFQLLQLRQLALHGAAFIAHALLEVRRRDADVADLGRGGVGNHQKLVDHADQDQHERQAQGDADKGKQFFVPFPITVAQPLLFERQLALDFLGRLFDMSLGHSSPFYLRRRTRRV